MYLKLIRSKSFLKDYEKKRLSDQHYIIVLGKLLNNEVLSDEYLEHELKGNWKNYRELHISGDLLLIYKKTESELTLIRIGTQSIYNNILKWIR
ncbi:MAG: type II toxin-antitoxin system YafQ family toxin [Campylobacterales bacterium]